MTGLVNVAADAEERADDAKNKAEELATQVDEIDASASKLTNFAGQSIRSATDDGLFHLLLERSGYLL